MIRPALAVVLVALGASTALAGPLKKPAAPERKSEEPGNRRVIGVLDVRVDGVPAEIAAQFQTGLEAQLDSRRYWLSGRAKMRERMTSSTKWTDGCLVGLCLSDVKTQTGAELVLLAALTGSGTSFGYVVTLVRTDNGQVIAQQSDRCDVCTLNEVMSNATLATIELINAVPDALPDPAAENSMALTLAVLPYQQRIEAAHRHERRLGIGLTITGLALAGAGLAVYLAADKPYALGVTAAGGSLVLGGVTVLAF
ncbi:MAG: hypothetical protein H0T79_15640 [Deltaproteobacteria bacterium]|nr:hypothetical protein [Deltaproteobacteria bacterium]